VRVDLPLLVASAVFLLLATWNSPIVWYEGLLALAALAVYIQLTIAEKDRYVGMLVEEFVETEGTIGMDDAAAEDRREGELDSVSDTEHLSKPGPGREPGESNGEVAREDDTEREHPASGLNVWTLVRLFVSIGVVFGAASLLVRSIIDLAAVLGTGTELIAITAVAIGTSLPEVVVSVIAVRRGLPELAVGNVLGSNLFNSFLVTGIPSLAGDLVVTQSIRSYGLPVMVIVTVLYFFITQDREITRSEGLTLLLLYVLFLINLGQFR